MNLYEVIFWGSKGNPDAEDTIFLVRAPDFKVAIQLLEEKFLHDVRTRVEFPGPDAVYEIGRELSVIENLEPRILRGPYITYAYNCGWRAWQRKFGDENYTDEWEETKS